MSAITFRAAVQDADVIPMEADYVPRKRRAAKRWGEGRAIIIRMEPEDEGASEGQRRYYFGRVLKPFSDYTGYRMDELHSMLKALCMQEGKTSITELNDEEMRDYTEAAEHTLREWCADAYLLTDA
jgi:hypothetical protein